MSTEEELPPISEPQWELDVGPEPEPVEPPVDAPPPAPIKIIEGMLFVGGPPLTPARACEVIRGLTEDQFQEAVGQLNEEYRRQNRPYFIQPHQQGFMLTIRPRFRSVIDKLYGSTREARLSQQAIDVLSLVAYRQPTTKQEIDNIRGADSAGQLRQLIRRGLVAVSHRGEAANREVCYGTTDRFLKTFGLSSLDDLPQTQDFQRL